MQNQTQNQTSDQNLHQTQNQNLPLTANSIHLTGAPSFTHMAKQKNVQVFITIVWDIEYTLAEKKHSNLVNLSSITYYKFLNMFNQNRTNTLLPHQSQNYAINFIFKVKSKNDFLYFITTNELKMLKKWLNENLQKEFIHLSTFFISSLMIFICKFRKDI